ncbi:hypothetical protein JCM10213_008768 [Rhodosporidiobolus nylandii]
MTSLKRAKSISDIFRPKRTTSTRDTPTSSSSRAPLTARPAPPPDPSSADYSSPQRRDPSKDISHSRPTIDTSRQPLPRSGTGESFDEIFGAYGSESPTKTRAPVPERQDSQWSTASRDTVDQMPVLGASTSSAYPRAMDPLKSSTRSNSSTRPKPPRVKSNGELDLIDRLDISGLYGGGGFVRHEGPYAAATSNRNVGGHAPIDAFDPSAFTLAPQPSQPPASSRRKASNGVSDRAQAALAAMDEAGGRADGPYGAARASKQEVSMGFPSKQNDAKSAQLMEIYGFRDAEAWEDYGAARYDPASAAQSRDSVVPTGTSKEDRMQRAQSIWDIEATLRAGKPVGSAPPPVPVMPAEWSAPEVSPSAKPKRSKSLAARFRAGRKNPNNPLTDDGFVSGDDGREAGQARAGSVPTTPVEDRRGARELPLVPPQAVGSASPIRSEEVEQLGQRTAGIRFDDSVERERASGMTRTASGQGEEKEKKPGGLKRLFSTRRK